MSEQRPVLSPLLDHCPETLPREAYLDEAWYRREQATVWARNWVCVGRLDAFKKGTLTPVDLGGAPVVVARTADGGVSAYHNMCPHRGAELCAGEKPIGQLITCPYHAWSYAAEDGRLISTGYGTPTAEFERKAHGLRPVSHEVWAGFLFLNRAARPAPLRADPGLAALDNWPMDSLRRGHVHERILNCNWKVFWENYNECLHCPGIHPELCDMVPIYGKGVMSTAELPDPAPDMPRMKLGAESWTMSGAVCGPVFAGLTAQERQEGYRFVTLYPSCYIVAHVDYVRCVRLQPLGPERTRLVAEWYFAAQTLAQPGFDAAEVADFALLVLEQDGDAAEMNQRGIRSPAYERGHLMPQEFDIHGFHKWLLKEMEERHE